MGMFSAAELRTMMSFPVRVPRMVFAERPTFSGKRTITVPESYIPGRRHFGTRWTVAQIGNGYLPTREVMWEYPGAIRRNYCDNTLHAFIPGDRG